ncbi:MAG: CcdB family protein [Gammaproteobacteria bacterium]|nr:CcdB family protein [Gammaproteobacteria bacterium]NNL51355.1 CcdB family protein [Woeseiaceae bacterium]
MRQFDIVENTNSGSKRNVPYLLILQAPLFDELATRVVAPLIPLKSFGKPLAHLTPVISVADASFVVSMTEIACVPLAALGPKADSISEGRLEIISALDFLFSGS